MPLLVKQNFRLTQVKVYIMVVLNIEAIISSVHLHDVFACYLYVQRQ